MASAGLLIGGCQSPDEEASSDLSEQALRGRRVYQIYCMSCHQADGSGLGGIYPPLSGTDWVVGDKGRLIRLVLHGMQGPVEIGGERYDNLMPGQYQLSDDQVADVLTFVRQSFGNDAESVAADDVFAVRRSEGRRGTWQARELRSQTGIPDVPEE